MKKRILISLIFVSSILTMNAQQWNGTSPNPLWTNSSIGIGTDAPNAKLSIKRPAVQASIKAADEGGNGYLIIDGFISGTQSSNAVSLNHYINGHVFLTNGGGYVGIGTDAPNAKLSIKRPAGQASIKAADEGGNGYLIIDGFTNGAQSSNAVSLNHYTNGHVFLANGGGNVGIGTDAPSYKLDVCGTIRAKEVKVDLQGVGCIPDFVFKDDYKLMDLKKLEEFVKTNQHLSGIAPEKEMIENGLDMKDMQIKLLQKIEEMTLYMIDQNKKIEQQNTEIQALKNEITELKTK